jgi:hypothetical protein
MKPKVLAALLCLLAGIPLLAYGLSSGAWLLIVAGMALELVFLYFAWEWISGASRPMGAQATIKPAANAAWSMKDEPAQPAEPGQEKR